MFVKYIHIVNDFEINNILNNSTLLDGEALVLNVKKGVVGSWV